LRRPISPWLISSGVETPRAGSALGLHVGKPFADKFR
jgi:hypothetical protein